MAERYKRTSANRIDDLPGLFDWVDMTRPDIAGEVIDRAMSPGKAEPDEFELPENSFEPSEVLRFISFGSGSSGNCAYIGTNRGGVLIDAGVDNDFVTAELLRNGIDITSIAGILLTHDHSDHIKYAYSLLRRNRNMLLYCTPKTFNGLLRRHNVSRRIKDYHKPVYKEFAFDIAGMTVTPFEVSHDGTDNVGFAIEAAGLKFVVTTDTGYITERADFYMRDANVLMIESNYDIEMLCHGSYPEHLKARIISDHGHLDNVVTAEYIRKIAPVGSLSHIFLCHLSHDNNHPEIAIAGVKSALADVGCKVADEAGRNGIQLMALPRFGTSPLIIVRR